MYYSCETMTLVEPGATNTNIPCAVLFIHKLQLSY